MSNSHFPTGLKYTKEHEWVKVEGNIGLIGITDFAQDALGDVVFVEVPTVGQVLNQHEQFGVVESVKTVSDLYAPVSGQVAEVNGKLDASPELVNQDAYGDGWMIKIELSNPSEVDGLLDAAAYEAHVKEAGH